MILKKEYENIPDVFKFNQFSIKQLHAYIHAILNPIRFGDNNRRIMHSNPNLYIYDISDLIGCFSHLELDIGFRLVLIRQDGLLGGWNTYEAQIAGYPISKLDSIYNDEFPWDKKAFPEGVKHPLCIVFHDGTPEGLLETAILNRVIKNMGRIGEECNIITEFPDDYNSWEKVLELESFSPILVDRETIYLFEQTPILVNGSKIIIERCDFYNTPYLSEYEKKLYPGLIDVELYATRGCCKVQGYEPRKKEITVAKCEPSMKLGRFFMI